MKKVLFYVEPHPIRNLFIEFISPADLFAKIALHENFDDIDWRMFSNKFLLDLVVEHFKSSDKTVDFPYPHEIVGTDVDKQVSLDTFKDKLIYPDEEDHNKICSMLSEWNESEIRRRNELVDGVGSLSEYYESVLEKIYNLYEFTHIILWSENGAVRNFCKKYNIQPIHMELGPTRQPFQETILIDTLGTNGNSGFCKETIFNDRLNISSTLWNSDFYDKSYTPTREILLGQGSAVFAESNSGGLSFLTGSSDPTKFSNEINQKENYIDNYVLICLQLADDLNTLKHSHYLDPKDFLSEIIPKVLKLGYKVLVKRHPGARGRVYNLIKENEAVEHAKTLSDNVFILGSQTSQKDFILLNKNAKAVISINSSVSCESWIIGVPGLITGSAAFDIEGRLYTLTTDFLNGGELIDNSECLKNIEDGIEFGLNKYFIPRSQYLISAVLSKVINSFDENIHPSFVKWYTTEIDIFELLAIEKIKNIESELTKYDSVDFYQLIENSIPNENFYNCAIDQYFDVDNELYIKGWAAKSGITIVYLFIEYGNNIYLAESCERLDIYNAFGSVPLKSGFAIKELFDGEMPREDAFNLYIYGDDNICRHVKIIKE
ncbi:GT99 family glycosyltransferase N-terminal domain-containing protein [Pantoea endophytica]